MSLSDWELFLLFLGIESWVQVSKQLIDQEEALSSLLLHLLLESSSVLTGVHGE